MRKRENPVLLLVKRIISILPGEIVLPIAPHHRN
jgi:hypothetical protein